MSHFHASSLHWTNLNEELEQLLANVPKLTIEEHGEWRELANMMQNVVAPPEAFFWTVHARDQIFGEVGKVYTVKWNDVLDDENYHNIVYNKDLDQPAIVARWTTLRFLSADKRSSSSVTFKVYLTEQKVICNSLDVPSSIYYFLKDKGWTHLHLEDVVECRLVFNYYRKTLKIGARWKHFCETLSLTADMEIVFEFIDLNINRVLYWSCL
ncbi:hypothetical protein GmHk_06G018015 [Glycine max]|nr:hypothetical protein GmHk_06G018015 [Glycine max]